jgi:hypothetical protein
MAIWRSLVGLKEIRKREAACGATASRGSQTMRRRSRRLCLAMRIGRPRVRRLQTHDPPPEKKHFPIQILCNKPSVGAVASYGTRQRFQFGLWSITAVYCLLERDLKFRLP